MISRPHAARTALGMLLAGGLVLPIACTSTRKPKPDGSSQREHIGLPTIGATSLVLYETKTAYLNGLVVSSSRRNWAPQHVTAHPMLLVWHKGGMQQGALRGLPNRPGRVPVHQILNRGAVKIGDRTVEVQREPMGSIKAILVDGKAQSLFDGAFAPVASPKSKRYAYCGVSRASRKQFVVFEGKKGPEYDWCTEVVFSPDGKRWAYLAGNDGHSFIVIDGQRKTKRPCRKGPVVSTDNKGRLSYTHSGGNEGILWSPDSKHAACILPVDSGKGFDLLKMFIDDKAVSAVQAESLGRWSADSKRYAYEGYISGVEKCMVLDGKVLQKHDDIRCFAFSPDGKRFAYIAWDPETLKPACRVVEGGRIGPRFGEPELASKKPWAHDVTGLVFSPDSRHLAYVARREDDRGKWSVVLDGKKGREYDDILTVPVFKKGRLIYLAVERGETTTRVLVVAEPVEK